MPLLRHHHRPLGRVGSTQTGRVGGGSESVDISIKDISNNLKHTQKSIVLSIIAGTVKPLPSHFTKIKYLVATTLSIECFSYLSDVVILCAPSSYQHSGGGGDLIAQFAGMGQFGHDLALHQRPHLHCWGEGGHRRI